MDERLAGPLQPMPDPGAMSFARLRDSAKSVRLHLQIPPRSEILTFLEKKGRAWTRYQWMGEPLTPESGIFATP
jgi:hypothetical protein